MSNQDWSNKLLFGDNLDILRNHIRDESVDLIGCVAKIALRRGRPELAEA